MIDFRATHTEDLERLMELVAQAQARFRRAGIDQWQDGYPTRAILEADIEAQNSYVGEVKGRVLLGGCLSFDGEPTYAQIYEGSWLNDEPYGVVHRLMVADEALRQGYAEAFMRYCLALCQERGVGQMRIDTHADNRPMQRLLLKLGFQPCGRIVLESGADRDAYQLNLKLQE